MNPQQTDILFKYFSLEFWAQRYQILHTRILGLSGDYFEKDLSLFLEGFLATPGCSCTVTLEVVVCEYSQLGCPQV